MRLQQATILLVLIIKTVQKASNFGLLTVTHSRNGDYSVLKKYLKIYAQTRCYAEFITEINLVWNNEIPPQSTSILQSKQNWKIPVNFYKTTFNSMDHRYRLPKESTAQLLYSLDDDIIVDCNTFKITLEQYNRLGNGRLGRIVTNEVRGYKFQPSLLENGEFAYQGHTTAEYFTISEPGAAFIPRHYLQIYYLQITELKQLRNEILDVKNCDDIFFYAFVQHFYPQLPAVYVLGQKDYKNTDPKVGQSKTKNVYQTRSKCISHISEFMGYNPLRFFSKNCSKFLQNWSYDNLQMILEQKIRGFNEVQSEKAIEKGNQQSLSNQEIETLEGTKPQELPTTTKEVKNQQQPTKNQYQKKQVKNKLDNGNESSISPKSTNDQAKQDGIKKKLEEDVAIKLTFQQEVAIQIFLIVLLVILCIQLYKRNCDKKMHYRIRIDQEEQAQSISIRLPGQN